MAPKREQRYTILVADDSEMNRCILRSMLEDSYDLIEAEDGLQALAILQQQEQKMQQFHSTAMQDLQRQQAALMAPIQEKIQSAIQAVGKENNLTFIIESNVPLYVGTDVTDVTSMVRTKLGI